MTEETKKLFDAPWRATNLDYVEDANGYYVCECGTHLTASNIARLPELYDALHEAADGKCWSCAGVNVDSVFGNGCPKGNDETCYVAKWIDLLRKVRDGK